MEQQIAALDDARALQILSILTRSQEDEAAEYDARLQPTQQEALGEAFGVAPAAHTVSEGDLVRAALLVYAEDPLYKEGLAALLKGPAPRSYDLGATVAVTTAVLFLLQSHLRFERLPDGRWTVLFEKKPTSNSMLKPLVQKLLGFLGSGAQAG